MSRYILAVDQSTQGTKGLLFDEQGILVARADRPHRQIVSELGWVSHSLPEIRENVLAVCRHVIEKAMISPDNILALGISNQRETTAAWDKATGEPICDAIVWQCARAAAVCTRYQPLADQIRANTGLPLSPYFPASKMRWILENVPAARTLAKSGKLAFGTIDSWLIFSLTKERAFKTDYSNASRTQLFNIRTLEWDAAICAAFEIPMDALAEVCMSDSCFGTTDLDGYLAHPIPICGVLGDSHGALFGQDCRKPGQTKATYGTGSSVMMHVGSAPRLSSHGLVTSLAWGMNGRVDYVLEGNLNYTGAVITWLKTIGLIQTDAEASVLASAANRDDHTYFVPAFTGLGAPYWDPQATGLLTGISRTTGRNEIVKAGLDCIAYQITDLIELMRQESGTELDVLRVDGGPTASSYLMQLQSDLAQVAVQVPNLQELSGLGAAYAAGIASGLYSPDSIYAHIRRTEYRSSIPDATRNELLHGWKQAVAKALLHA